MNPNSELILLLNIRVFRELFGLLKALEEFGCLRDEIESFWVHPSHQKSASWCDHQDINAVMLATSLAPDGFLLIQ